MKVSLESILSLNHFYKTTGNVAEIGVDKLVEKIGAQLGAVDEVIDIGSKYKGIVVAKVVSCEKHPDADKLSLCMIDAGKAEHIQVVCGAPNVAAGQTVAWIPPGTAVPETVDKEPFVIEAREIRGKMSHGMLASPKELALGDSHDGILVLDDWLKPGQDFAEAAGLKDDFVLDIENKMFTHRPDCFGYMGVARELAGIQQMAFKSPDFYVEEPAFPKAEADLKLTVKNELPKLVPRFSALPMSGVKVGPSPAWLVVELAKLGQKSINNIVDLTNYLMLLTGQPLHAYDYDKVKSLSGGEATIIVRQAAKGEKLALLNGKTVEAPEGTVMIATDKQAIGLGGVMGGAETEVDDSTTNIIIECANFDMFTTRRTSMALGLFTDAVTRFSKGQSPRQTLAVLAKMADAVKDLSGAKYGELIDVKHFKVAQEPVKVSAQFINERLGEKLSPADMAQLLANVEFYVKTSGEELQVMPPFWRTDIEIPEDVVEEVGRLYGYDQLPLELPRRDLTPPAKDPLLTVKAEIRRRLAKAGANEVLTYSFIDGDLLKKVGQDSDQAFQLSNALSPDLQYFRLSLMPSLLDKIHPNQKAGHDSFALFELGKTHGLEQGSDDDGLPLEYEFTALTVAVSDKLKPQGSAYYLARRYVQELLGQPLSFKPVGNESLKFQVTKPYEPTRSTMVSLVDGTYLGIIGEFKPSVRRNLKLPKYAAGFELDTTALQKALNSGTDYTPLSRFPSVKQDMTLKVAAGTPFAKVHDFLNDQTAKADLNVAVEPRGIYQPENTGHRNLTFRFTVSSYERTLTDTEVNKLLDSVADAAKSQLHAERV